MEREAEQKYRGKRCADAMPRNIDQPVQRKNETTSAIRDGERWQQSENAPSQSALPTTRIPIPAREKFRMIAAIVRESATPQKIQRFRPLRRSSWPQARIMIAVRPKRFPVWLRFGNGPKLRSLCQNGGLPCRSQKRIEIAARTTTPAVNKRSWSRASRNSSCWAQTT